MSSELLTPAERARLTALISKPTPELLEAMEAALTPEQLAEAKASPQREAEEMLAAYEAGDPGGMLLYLDNQRRLGFVVECADLLRRKPGLYEATLAEAFTDTRANNRNITAPLLALLLGIADRKALRAAGEPLPSPGPFTVYRGCAGRGAARRVRGYSWSADFDQAKWFALRYRCRLPNPAVYSVTVGAEAVLWYTNARSEAEFIVQVPADARVRMIWRSTDAAEDSAWWEQETARRRAREEEALAAWKRESDSREDT